MTGDLPALTIDLSAGNPVDWQSLTCWLAPVGRRWDVAVLVNLPPDGSWVRPAELLDAINAQAAPERQVSWKVLAETFRRLEADGYIARQEMTRVPRETRYWILAPGRRLVTALTLLEAWLERGDEVIDRDDLHCGEGESSARTRKSGTMLAGLHRSLQGAVVTRGLARRRSHRPRDLPGCRSRRGPFVNREKAAGVG
jgi:DNA-binding HxlR family transcriptional regulator